MTMSYYHAPEEIYDDPEVAVDWACKSWGIALKAAQKKNLKKKTKP